MANALLIIIEPADLSIDDNVNISMGGSRTGYGRMDPIASYSGTQRSMSIRFKMIKSEVLNGQDAVTNNSLTANLLKQMAHIRHILTLVTKTHRLLKQPLILK